MEAGGYFDKVQMDISLKASPNSLYVLLYTDLGYYNDVDAYDRRLFDKGG